MKQILQNLTHGQTLRVEAPDPQVGYGQLQLYTTTTLISSGTERMLVDFGKASYLEKARQQPEKVKMVLEKIKTDGFFATVSAVRSKLAQPLPLGYCHVGVVAHLGLGVQGYKIGDRVVSNGPHADIVTVAKNLCVKIPDQVDDETAAFTVLASIGLQGIRLAAPTLGESVVVMGVGLIGLLTVQLLRAQGCRVLAIDLDERKLSLARQLGAKTCCLIAGEDPVVAALAFSRGHGVDAVMITAATQSNDPVTYAARMSRKRGRIILVGVTGLELNRADFYEKELSFQVSCSYGPGRYDPHYENQGLDYPIGFVRWTEQRNFEACLDMMADGRLNVKPLITHRYLFDEAEHAYQTLLEEPTALGIVLHYPSEPMTRSVETVMLHEPLLINAKKPVVGFIGAGNYASRILIPAFQAAHAQLHMIATSQGTHAAIYGKKAGFTQAVSSAAAIFQNEMVNTVVIATRHYTHARLVCESLAAGKHVFVEKPLAMNLKELSAIEAAYHMALMSGKNPLLMVGFNRRFAPHIQKMKKLIEVVQEPKTLIITVNAGKIPLVHWTQDPVLGGGRILGEACHFIDLMRYLVNAEITSVNTCRMEENSPIYGDQASITLSFADGSLGTIHYFANGATAFPKERVEIFTAGRVLQLDNFRQLKGFGWPGFKKMHLWRQNKGQQNCVGQFLKAIEQGTASPISLDEIIEVARVTIEAAR